MVHFGPFWPEGVYFAPFRSASRTLAFPDLEQERFSRLSGLAPKNYLLLPLSILGEIRNPKWALYQTIGIPSQKLNTNFSGTPDIIPANFPGTSRRKKFVSHGF